jgi:CBS domain-containing protein
MIVKELMQAHPVTISVDATVADAVERLAATRAAALAVVDRFGRAVGMLSARNVLDAERGRGISAAARARFLEATLVLEIMDPWPETVGPETSLHDAARHEGRPLFVEREGVLVGVLSPGDVVLALAEGRLGPAVVEAATY